MKLPFYVMSAGTSWDGLVSLRGDDLHFELLEDGQREALTFDVPLELVREANFQRGLVSRKLSFQIRSADALEQFPAGVSGEQVELMVPRSDRAFDPTTGPDEVEYEELVGQIARRVDASKLTPPAGLSS